MIRCNACGTFYVYVPADSATLYGYYACPNRYFSWHEESERSYQQLNK